MQAVAPPCKATAARTAQRRVTDLPVPNHFVGDLGSDGLGEVDCVAIQLTFCQERQVDQPTRTDLFRRQSAE
jgi:hypothetical protein